MRSLHNNGLQERRERQPEWGASQERGAARVRGEMPSMVQRVRLRNAGEKGFLGRREDFNLGARGDLKQSLREARRNVGGGR